MKTETLEKAIELKKNLSRYEFFQAKLKEAWKIDIRFSGSNFILPSVDLEYFIREVTDMYEARLHHVVEELKDEFEKL